MDDSDREITLRFRGTQAQGNGEFLPSQESRLRLFRKKAEELKAEFIEQVDSQLSDLLENILRDLDEPKNGETKVSQKSNQIKGKQFLSRQSLLTELLEISHIRTIYNIFVALLIVFSINTLIYDFIETGRLIIDFSIITWAFGKFSIVVTIWLTMMAMTVMMFPLFYVWVSNRNSWCSLPDVIWLLLYIVYLSVMLLFPLQEIFEYDLPPVSSIIVLTEQIRLMMKMHAFVRENIPRVVNQGRADKSSKQKESLQKEIADDVEEEEEMPGFSQYLYFLFAPTLIYRNSYPMTPSIRWNYVVSNFIQVGLSIFYTYYIFVRFCVPVFRNTGKEPGNFKNLFLSAFGCMMPGTLVLIIGFFAILHSWFNAFAEMLRFADRMFYIDWWNSPSFSDYYRTWNVVVHDWLYAYIYKDLLKVSSYKYRPVAMVGVFLISAVFHEYILTVAFRFFFPVLFVMFAGIGLLFTFLKPKKTIAGVIPTSVSRIWNIFMWVGIIVGNGLLMCLYSQEWYANINCPRQTNMFWDVVTPRSWSSECVGKHW